MDKAVFAYLGHEDVEEYGIVRRRYTYEIANKTGDPVKDYLLFCAKVFDALPGVRIEMRPEDDANITVKSTDLHCMQDAIDFVPRLEKGMHGGARYGIRGYVDVEGVTNKLWYYVEKRRSSDLVTVYCYDEKYMELEG